SRGCPAAHLGCQTRSRSPNDALGALGLRNISEPSDQQRHQGDTNPFRTAPHLSPPIKPVLPSPPGNPINRSRPMPTLTPHALRVFTQLTASRMGREDAEAPEVADHLIRATLAGHASHGVGMLPSYVRNFHNGLLIPNQTPDTVLDAGALLVIDARRGFGQQM